MTYFAGLDVSLRSTHICVINDDGELLAEGKTDSEVEDIVAFFDEIDVSEVGLEAGTLTQYLTYGLQAAGFDVVCMEARQVKAALCAMRNKTDKNDARGIAQLLRSGWYSRVHVKSVESHQVRALLSSRRTVLGQV
jgi:transposase